MEEVVYGPYKRRDGRKHVVIVYGHEKTSPRKTVSYPKYLMEKHLGRELAENETVHHINGDFRDDRIENLEVVERSIHSKNHQSGHSRETITFPCPVCQKEVTKFASEVRHNRSQGKAGPYCSRRCAGRAHN